jgi:hypothetical protein
MCFSPPKIDPPEAPPVPNKNNEETRAAQAEARRQAQQSKGRQATILTTPLGTTGNTAQNRQRTRLTGL